MKIEQIKQAFMSNEIRFEAALDQVSKQLPLHEAIGIVREWKQWREESAPKELWIRIELDEIDRELNEEFYQINFASRTMNFSRSECTLYELDDEVDVATLVVSVQYAAELGILDWAKRSGACLR